MSNLPSSSPCHSNTGAQPQASVSPAAGSSNAPEDLWLPFIRDLYPDLQGQTYFLPPLHFHRTPHSVLTIAGQTVRVVDTPPPRGHRRRPPPPSPPPSNQKVAGNLFTENPAKVEPVHVQDTDRRDDEAQLRSLQCLHDVYNINTQQVMMVLSQLQFRQYLDNKTNPEGTSNPLHAAAIAQLPNVKPLPVHIADGECDILIIHRHHGFVIGEVKSVGCGQYFHTIPHNQQDKIIADVVQKALTQLNNQETALRHLMSDLDNIRVNNGVAPITITKTLFLPSITSWQLRRALGSYASLAQALCHCMDSGDVSQAVARCLCDDHRVQPSTWWHHAVLSRTPDPGMTPDLYERLVARFCGPATTVDVATPSPPRKVVRTLGQAVAETGLRFSSLALTPAQVALLNELSPEPRYMYLQGPPGCGKTVVLYLKALQWLKRGKTLCVLSVDNAGRAVSALMQQQLLSTVGASAAAATTTQAQVHWLCYDIRNNPGDLTCAVDDLLALARGGDDVAVIMDEIDPDRVQFKDFITRVFTAVPTMSVWAAGLWCIDHRTSRLRPSLLCVETLTVPLRCPPSVTREVQRSHSINNTNILRYSTPAQPVTTEGPAVRWLYHRGQPGHSGDRPLDCASCADSIAGTLKELDMGCTLHYKDMWILCGFSDAPSDTDVMIQRLRQHHLVPVGVMRSPLSDPDSRELALATVDQVVVTDNVAVSGLERRVVVGMRSAVYEADRSHIMSRCTAFLLFIDPPPEVPDVITDIS